MISLILEWYFLKLVFNMVAFWGIIYLIKKYLNIDILKHLKTGFSLLIELKKKYLK